MRDAAVEASVFTFISGLAGDYVQLKREDVKFQIKEGTAQMTNLQIKQGVLDKITDALQGADIPAYCAHGFITEIQLSSFYPTDVLDGDFDYPISAKIKGMVIVLEPNAYREAYENRHMTAAEKRKQKKREKAKKKEQKKTTKEAAKARKQQPPPKEKSVTPRDQ